MAHLTREGLRAQSISGYLLAVRHLSIEAGFTPRGREECPRLCYVLRGVGRSQATTARPTRLPITAQILLSLKEVWERGTVDTYSARLLWAMALTAFFGCFQLGELTVQDLSSPPAVEASDVSFEESTLRVRIHLRFSKTDTAGSGADIILGSTGDSFCPVTALGNYLWVRPPGPVPLFVSSEGSPMARATFVAVVRVPLLAAGISSEGYTGHSFRIVAATSATCVGVPAHLIKAMGRWSSNALMFYLRLPPETLASIARHLSNPS